MALKRLLLGSLFLVSFFCARSQEHAAARTRFSFNDGWKYKPSGTEFGASPKTDDSNWQRTDLPHTWNAHDPFDDDATYRRGISWYRKTLKWTDQFKNKKVLITFEGANQVTDLYVNGAFVGQHKGGYTAFTFDITSFLKPDTDNLIAVQVNNAQDNFIPPLSIGYAMYGGIYRDVWISTLNDLHFTTTDHGATGVYISTPSVSASEAQVAIRTVLVNESGSTRKINLVYTIRDADGKVVSALIKPVSFNGASLDLTHTTSIKAPRLWSPEHPYLYTVQTRLVENAQTLDEITSPLGFRWFSFDAATGFSLNGKKYLLKGTNRHQDFKDRGSALTDADHYRDIKIIKDMGCNFLRLAHYPQAPEVLRLADKMGLLIWEEVPVVNNINPDPQFLANSQETVREMIRQNYNHPSVILWGSMNEVLLWSKGSERIQTHEAGPYVDAVKNFAQKMDSTVRAEDPYRASTMAMHFSDDYEKFKLAGIPKVAGWNIYNGWYSGKVEEFGELFDQKHQAHPQEVILVSEYGAESDKQINTENPQRLDFSGQYQRLYHESYLAQINKRPYFAGTAIWNEFDFSQPNVGGTISHLNHKGMVTWDRIPKDVYYLYKANWNAEPMVYIATRDWLHRGGKAGQPSTIDVYSNLENISITVNGKDYPAQKGNEVHKFSWTVNLREGKNTLIAKGTKNGAELTDQAEVTYAVFDDNLKAADFSSLAINVGSNTQYTDDSEAIWINDRPYKAGSYGYLGGTPAMMGIKSLITHTDDTPLFYSYLDNITGYKLDVPNGTYEVELCFAEPEKLNAGDRVFDVSINNTRVENALDLTAGCGFAVAIKKKYIVEASNGITISFNAIKGKPILNGIKLKKL